MEDRSKLIQGGVFSGWTEEQIIAYRRGYFHSFSNIIILLHHGTTLSKLDDYCHRILSPWFYRGNYSPPPDLPIDKGNLSYCGGYWMEFPEVTDGEIENSQPEVTEGEINSLLLQAEKENSE